MVNFKSCLTGLAALALAGEGLEVTVKGAEMLKSVESTYQSYKVKVGDNYWAIGRANNVSVEELEKANPGVDYNKLRPGQVINVPAYIARKAESVTENYSIKNDKTPQANGEGASEDDATRLILQRTKDTGKSMMGTLYLDVNKNKIVDPCDTQLCYTLEPPWKNNKRNVSCIPAGEYSLKERTSPKFRRHYLVESDDKDNKERDMILVHRGNSPENTHGCVLVGETQAENFVGSSAVALDELRDRFVGKNLKLTILNPN